MKPAVRDDLVGLQLQLPAEVLATALDRHPGYRVVREIKPMRRTESRFRRTGELTVCVLDVETTGTDRHSDRITELAMQRVRIDQFGRIVETGRPYSWLEDPGIPIPQEIVAKTGITDEMVAGRSISDGEACGLITSADVVLSHNAAFDRPFVDRRLDLGGQAWICSLNDIEWRDHGFEGRSLADLLLRCGWFFQGAHRASADVNALLHLLDHRLDTGGTVMKELLRTAARSTWVIDAFDAPFSAKDLLKERGYRWDADRKVWRLTMRDDEPALEQRWLSAHVYGGADRSSVRPITWRERYSLR